MYVCVKETQGSAGGFFNHHLNHYQRTRRAKLLQSPSSASLREHTHTERVVQAAEGVRFWQPGGTLFDVGQSEH